MEEKSAASNWIPTKKFLSDALLIAAVTGTGYLSAFTYQFGYLQYFGIPTYFIDINLGDVLLTAAIGFLTLLSIATCIDLMSRDMKSRTLKILAISLPALVMLFILFAPVLGLYLDLSNTVIFGLFLIALIALIIGLIIYAIKTKDRIHDKSYGLLSLAETAFGSFPVLFIASLIFFVFYSAGIGKMVAQGTKNYLVANTNPELVIIGTYSENFIGLNFNSSTKTFSNDVTLISPEKIASDNIVFTGEDIGPLNPAR
jgi:hypothetical protein